MAGLIIKPRSRIFHGHDWIYGSEILKTFGNPQPGEVVTLKDFRDRPLGSAIYNPASQIVARRISRRKQDLDADFFERRIRRALNLRESMAFAEPVYRLVWSEADGLPGVVIDRYGDHYVLQTLTLAMDQRRELIAESLRTIFGDITVIERNDSPIRKAEGLELHTGLLAGEWSGPLEVCLQGFNLTLDLMSGQKTGIYLDQLDNQSDVGALAAGKTVLDCFCNQGGFSLHAARAGARSVLAIDISPSAVEATRENAVRNGLEIEVREANVFDFLKGAEEGEQKFDLIVLDPPSFTKSRKSVTDAMRGYKEIHLRALKCLNPEGILSTYSCSHHVSEHEFQEMIVSASVDAKRTLRLLHRHGQRRDHPVILTLPETAYLKGWTFQAVGGF